LPLHHNKVKVRNSRSMFKATLDFVM